MIRLRTNGQEFELKPGTRITYRLRNPIFESPDGLIPGSYTMPFDLPTGKASEKNTKLLGNGDVIESITTPFKREAEVLFEDVFFKKGELVNRTVKSNATSVNFNFGLATLGDDFKTKLLRDIVDENVVIDNTDIYKKVYLKPGTAAVAPYSISINGKVFEGNTLQLLRDAINTDTTAPRAACVYVPTGSTPGGIAAPFLEITPVTNPNDPLSPLSVEPNGNNGNSASGFIWSVESFSLSTYYAGFSSFLAPYLNNTTTDQSLRFPFMVNYDLYDEKPFYTAYFGGTPSLIGSTKDQPWVNANWLYGFIGNDPNFGIGVNSPFKVRNLNSLQPFLRLRWVMDKIATYFGFEYEGDWLDEADTLNMLIDNASPLDEPQEYIGSTKFVWWRRSFNKKQLVPDIKVIDFFKMLRDRYNLAIYLNETTGKVRIQKREDIIRSTGYTDITNIASEPETKDNQSIRGLKFSAKRDENDKLATDDVYTIGDAEDEHVSNVSALPTQLDITTILGLSCAISVPAYSRKISDKFPLRIFHYLGIVASGGGWNYCAASKDATTYLESWAGTTGLYNTFWKRWTEAELNRRVVNQNWSMPYRRIIDLDWEVKYRFDRNDYFIKELAFTLENNRIVESTAELHTT
jgi:hypothetical protein